MPYIHPKGSTSSKIWFIFDKPYASDVPRGSLLSGAMGNVFLKMLAEAGIYQNNCYFTSRAPNTDDAHAFINIDGVLNQYQPPLVVTVGDVAGWFLPELRERGGAIATSKGQLAKYTGSLLKATSLQYNHYCMPLYGPERFVQDWAERNVTTYVDLQKLSGELEYWIKQGHLQPLPVRTLKYEDMELDEILGYLDRFRNASVLSDDIENPTWNSTQYAPHPGYPFLIGLADGADFGISFRLFRDKPSENRELWKRLDTLLYDVPVLLGQNFFNYDALFHEMLGFRIRKDRIQDTLIRHHILWPELSHKLQFMTRQYTREPYYKDEGHGWTMKHLNSYRKYNCLDATVTYEIYQAQESEFNDRPQLR
jgi:uracil-DNA glycosylase